MALGVNKRADDKGQKYLRPDDLAYFKNLRFSSRVAVDGAYSGKHKSPLKGYSQEFTDYREYNPGDEIRTIDWKAYGRTDKYIIKLFEKETVMTCHLLLDSSASMAFGGEGYEKYFGADDVSKYDYACYLAAALSYLTIKQGDKVGLTVFDSKIKYHFPPGGTYGHLYKMLSILENNKTGEQTSISQALRQAFPMYKRRGILIVISDLLDDADEIFEALDLYRHRNFEVILFHVLHKNELTLPDIASVNFIDSESGEKLSSIPGDIRGSYERELAEYSDSIASTARDRKIDYQLISTETPYVAALQEYMERRRI
ncbi:MAG: DUF58 domain-containing protein [Phycisphaerae bacterium]|nr:DUF58 domain-containing protein [Phycisphaerae bacterium]